MIAAAIIVLSTVVRGAEPLSPLDLTVKPGRLALATALELSLLAWTVFLWSWIIASFDVERPRLAGLLAIWRRSTLAKYLPGAVWSAAATAEMATRAGGSPFTLTASFLIQATFTLISSIVVGAFFYGGTSAVGRPAATLVLAIGIALTHPSAINAITRFAAKRSGAAVPHWTVSWKAGATLLLLHLLTWVAFGGVFALLLSALAPAAASWTMLAGINAAAFAAGFVAVFAPGGIGVRESILVVLLAPFIPAFSARLAVAAASRVWLVLTEILAGALTFAVTTRARRTVSPARSAAMPFVSGARNARHERGADAGSAGATDVEVLVDSRRALALIVERCRTARHSISISQLAFDADCVPVGTGAAESEPLLDVLVTGARRGVDVRIVLNGGLLLDTMPALRRAITACGADGDLRCRSIKAFPRMMHAKSIIIDEQDAFLMGASFVNGYWAGAAHMPEGSSNAHGGDGDRPLHDIAVHLSGGAAGTLAGWFDALWESAPPSEAEPARVRDNTRADLAHGSPRPTASAATRARIARTAPRRRGSAGATEILDEYLAAIADARDYVYLESQYFSARPIASAVRAALDARRHLQVILVINQNPDITGYRGWQNARLNENGLLEHPRVGVFALWSAVASLRSPAQREITQVFVHSKVGLIDDRWATIGSANLDGASLHSYGDDFASAAGRRIFGRFRNYDVNAVVTDANDRGDASDAVTAARRALWSRHIGVSADVQSQPSDGWVRLWNASAAANVAALRTGQPMHGRVLPYVTASHPRAQLAALGIDTASPGLYLRFDPGLAEVVCSPGWMKRLLPERWRMQQ